MFATGVKRREPAATEAQISKERGKPLGVPMIIAVVARTLAGHKVPVIEQTLAVGAAAMNILNAVHALGFGARWLTGANCYDPVFKRDFGLEETDQLVGFIHVGTPRDNAPATSRPDPAEFVSEWRRDFKSRFPVP
jgi:nitroreductase